MSAIDVIKKQKVTNVVEGVSLQNYIKKKPWQETPQHFFFRNNFLMFLNHRELMFAITKVLKINDGW